MGKYIFKRSSLIPSFFILLLLSTNVFAWDSVGTYTHRKMVEDALPLLSASEYPDIDKFSNNLIDNSADEKFSHNWNILANGGSPVTLWDKKVLPQYNKGDYSDAYDYIGSILHLVQDQGVPAHAFDIQHISYVAWGGLWGGDFLEKYANNGSHYYHGILSVQSGTDPLAFYGNMISRTQGVVITNVVSPPIGEAWSEYWQTGIYGPIPFPRDQDEDIYVIQHDNLVQHRITETINYVAGTMAAASKMLPPLIKNLVIVPASSISPQIDINNGTQISFQVFENRKSIVNIYITVDSPTGLAIKDTLNNVYDGRSFSLFNGTSLPYEGNFTTSWSGTLEDGSLPTDGEHTLYVQIQDQDGNVSTVFTHLFTIYTHPVLTISKTGNGTVTSSSTGIDCGNDCSEIYTHSNPVTLTANPDIGWTFSGWSGGGCSGTGTCQVTMNGDDTITAVFDPIQKWTIKNVDIINHGYDDNASIAIDSSGKVHISYVNSANHNLIYATNYSGSWLTVTLDSVGYFISIAVDSSGKVHISYFDWSNYDLKYATNASGSWVTRTIDSSGAVGCSTSIAIDSSDKVHISYTDWTNYNLKYATNASGSWVTQTVDNSGKVSGAEYTSIAIDSSDKIHISYSGEWSSDHLKYATNVSGSWIIKTLDGSSDNGNSSLAIDSSDKVHISYYNWGNDDINYVTNASGSWVTQLIYNSSSVYNTAIAIDSSDKVHISFSDWFDIKYATNASGSWIIETMDSSGDAGNFTSIAIDSSDKVHFSYSDWTNDALKYAVSKTGDNDKHTLIASKSGTGTGTVTSNPSGVSCGGVCRESYDLGTVVTLTPATDANSTFSGWTGGGCSGTGTCQVIINGDTTVTATFAVKSYNIAPIFSSGGIVSPSTTTVVNHGEDQTFATIPDAGYYILDVLIDSSSVGAVTAYTFTNVTAPHIIQANFVVNTYLLASSVGPGGVISPSQATVNYGANQTFTIAPDADYHILDVQVDGISVGPITSYLFTNVTADHLIEATVEPDCTPVATDDITCDDIDDDCDGSFDEDYVVTPTSCGQGACSENTGQLECQDGNPVDTCDSLEGAAPDDPLCDGIDDDCDGTPDDDYVSTVIYCGIGECLRSGLRECMGGAEVDLCTPGASQTEGPGDSTCSDSVDNDCDGAIDTADSDCFVDTDGDGIPDGDGSNPCTGGSIANCDDNCVDTPNPDQTDADSDGEGDVCDNCSQTDNPDQEDSDDDGYGNACDCDLNNDDFVGPQDFNMFVDAWWTRPGDGNWNADADFNGDDFVGPQDFNMFVDAWWTRAPWD